MRKLVNSHLYGKVNTKPSRGTPIDPNSCPYLPGGLGQQVTQAMGLDEGQPYLLSWAYNAVMDGAQPAQVRAVLAALGFVPDFRWRRPHPERSLVHPVSARKFCAVFVVLLLRVTDLVIIQALVRPTGLRGVVNGWYTVASYPSYGVGANGWRLALVKAGNQKAREGVVGFWAWLKGAAKAVDPANLLGSLPGEL